MMKTDIALVSIIIFNWNGWWDTIECMQSVQNINYHNFHILVVGNGYGEFVAQIRKVFPDVQLLETGKNLGYAGGNNTEIAHELKEMHEFILFLNKDMNEVPDILTVRADAASAYLVAGTYGAKSYYYSKLDTILELAGTC